MFLKSLLVCKFFQVFFIYVVLQKRWQKLTKTRIRIRMRKMKMFIPDRIYNYSDPEQWNLWKRRRAEAVVLVNKTDTLFTI